VRRRLTDFDRANVCGLGDREFPGIILLPCALEFAVFRTDRETLSPPRLCEVHYLSAVKSFDLRLGLAGRRFPMRKAKQCAAIANHEGNPKCAGGRVFGPAREMRGPRQMRRVASAIMAIDGNETQPGAHGSMEPSDLPKRRKRIDARGPPCG
jgi:hypothetical protein